MLERVRVRRDVTYKYDNIVAAGTGESFRDSGCYYLRFGPARWHVHGGPLLITRRTRGHHADAPLGNA